MRSMPAPCRIAPRAAALALGGCALQAPPDRAAAAAGAAEHADCRRSGRARRRARRGRRRAGWQRFNDPALTALVREALVYNADLRGRRGARRAGGRLRAARRRRALPDGQPAGARRRQDGRRRLRPQRRRVLTPLELDLWGRVRSGARGRAQQSEAAQADYAYARQSIAATGGQELVPRDRGATAARDRLEEVVRSSEALPALARERLRVGKGDEHDGGRRARPTSARYRDAVRQTRAGARAGAARARDCCSAAIRPPRSRSRQQLAAPAAAGAGGPAVGTAGAPARCDRAPSGAWPRRSTASGRRRPRGCRSIALTAGVSSVSSDLFVLQDRDNPVWSSAPTCSRRSSTAARCRRRSTCAPPSRSWRWPSTGASARARSARSRARCPRRSLRDREAILGARGRDNERALELARVRYQRRRGRPARVRSRRIALYAARTALLRVQSERLRPAHQPAPRAGRQLRAGAGHGQPPVGAPGVLRPTAAGAGCSRADHDVSHGPARAALGGVPRGCYASARINTNTSATRKADSPSASSFNWVFMPSALMATTRHQRENSLPKPWHRRRQPAGAVDRGQDQKATANQGSSGGRGPPLPPRPACA